MGGYMTYHDHRSQSISQLKKHRLINAVLALTLVFIGAATMTYGSWWFWTRQRDENWWPYGAGFYQALIMAFGLLVLAGRLADKAKTSNLMIKRHKATTSI